MLLVNRSSAHAFINRRKMTDDPVPVASLVATLAVALGFAHLPYGYYMVLHLLLCGVSLFFLFGSRLLLEDWERWVLWGFVVLYNPLLPVRIGSKAVWTATNIATVVLFWAISRRMQLNVLPHLQLPLAPSEKIDQ